MSLIPETERSNLEIDLLTKPIKTVRKIRPFYHLDKPVEKNEPIKFPNPSEAGGTIQINGGNSGNTNNGPRSATFTVTAGSGGASSLTSAAGHFSISGGTPGSAGTTSIKVPAMDPIVTFLHYIDRSIQLDRPIDIYFKSDGILISEIDPSNYQHERIFIPYTKINELVVADNNDLIGPEELDHLQILSDLRSTEISLYTSSKKNQEKIDQLTYQLREAKSLYEIEKNKADQLQKDLDELNESIRKRREELDHLALHDD